MKRLAEDGASTGLVVALVASVLLFLVAVVFGVWAFVGRQDYKNNVDAKVNTAVASAVRAEDAKKDAQFAQDEKKPLKAYNGPSAYGSIKVMYPKTWSGYVDDTDSSSTGVDGYFYPGVVPSLTGQSSAFALRVQVLDQSYSSVVQQLASSVKGGKLTASPYSLPNVSKAIGTRFDGEVVNGKQGSLVVLPLRAGSLKIWTEAPQFVDDFNKIILPNFTFLP